MVKEDYDRLQEYKKAGLKREVIRQLLKTSPNTLKKIWDMTVSEFNDYISNQGSAIEPYREFILDILETTPTLTNLNIYYKVLEAFPESNISESNFQKYMKNLREETGYDRFTKFSTSIRANPIPGEETQVDFGQYWMKDIYGKKRRVYFMIMVLRYSQLKYVFFQTKQFTSLSAIDAHIKGFKFFGGMTKVLVYDQDGVFCTSENYGNIILEKDFEKFLKEYHIHFVFCGAHHPQSKGTVENYVKIVKMHFLEGRTYQGIDELNSACLDWLDNTENNHYLIDKAMTPHELFLKEKPKLTKLKLKEYARKVITPHRVRLNAVHYRYAYYEVPLGYEGKEVDVESDGVNVIIRDKENNIVLAVHRYTTERGAKVKLVSDDLPEAASEIYIRTYFKRSKAASKFIETFKMREARYFIKGCMKIKYFIKIYKYKELESGFKFCVDHDLINILDLGTFLLMKYGEEKGKKALNKNYYYYKNHIEKLKEKTGKKKISEKEETAN